MVREQGAYCEGRAEELRVVWIRVGFLLAIVLCDLKKKEVAERLPLVEPSP